MADPTDSTESTEHFVQNLAQSQNRLMAYIFSLLGDRNLAADVLQETNLVLWRKHEEFQPEQPFLPWAFAIARFQVLAQLRDQRRDRQVLDPQVVEALSESVSKEAMHLEETQDALKQCLSGLDEEKEKLVRSRYFHSKTIDDLAKSAQRSVSDIKVSLFRIRKELAKCIELRLAHESRRS